MVGADKYPEITGTLLTGVLEEFKDEFTFAFIIGLITGILISYTYYKIKELFQENKNQRNIDEQEHE